MTHEELYFLGKLDSQHLLLETFLFAVMGRFEISAEEAGKMIAKYVNEKEFNAGREDNF